MRAQRARTRRAPLASTSFTCSNTRTSRRPSTNSGHLFHNVFSDVVAKLDALDPATLTESQKKVLADYDTLRAWLGASPRGELTTAQHEQMANGFVAYLREGKAPSVALQSTFARFRAWLTRVIRVGETSSGCR